MTVRASQVRNGGSTVKGFAPVTVPLPLLYCSRKPVDGSIAAQLEVVLVCVPGAG